MEQATQKLLDIIERASLSRRKGKGKKKDNAVSGPPATNVPPPRVDFPVAPASELVDAEAEADDDGKAEDEDDVVIVAPPPPPSHHPVSTASTSAWPSSFLPSPKSSGS